MASGGTLPEPICLRMCLTDQHKWQKVTDHWFVCTGNGCSADMCLYIRSLYGHNMKECDINCRTCSKVVSWLKHHVRSCNKEKCRYYERCQDVKYKIVGCFIPKLPPTSPPSHTPSLPTPPVSTTVPHSPPPDTPPLTLLTATSNDNMDFDNDVVPQVLLRGNFPEFPEERDLYVRTLEEQLPEGEEEVASIVDQSTRLREALLQLYRDGHAYQEGHHWRRIDMIGHGWSGTAYCIEYIRNNTWLVMEENAGRDLVTSCLESDWDCARILIESGSELEGKSQDGLTPLMICCKKGNIEMVELIINKGGNLKATDNSGQCCLHFDEVVKNLPLLKFLVECFHTAGISVEQYTKNWYTPLLVACFAGERCKDAVEVLLEAGADPNGHSRAAHRPLTVASAAGDSGIFHTLIDHGADIDVQDRSGCTPLLCSCLCYHHQLVEFLIARDARLNLSDNHKNTPLFACVESGAHNLVRKLLEHGAPVDIIRTVTKRFMAGSVEETPLAHCCGRGDLEMAKLLVAYGANINRLCAGTVPPVGFAIICWQFVMVEYMIGLDGFDKTTLGLSRPLIIGIKCENWVATHLIIVKFFGSLESAMQKANSGGYTQLYQQLLIFMEKTSGRNLDTMLQSEMASAAVQREELSRTDQHDSHYTIEQNLQKFCQICVSVLKANTDLTEVASVAMVEGHPHISDFFLECNTNTLSPQQLKSNFLYGQPSALRFSLVKKLLTLEDFVHHIDLFFPGRVDEFFTDLVRTFHKMNGGMELPTAVDECLDRLFSLQFCLAVSVRVRSYPRSSELIVPKQECSTTDQIVYADYIHGLEVCLEASKKKEQQLQTQLDTAQHEYQDKEQQCSKLEQELHVVMEKRIAVVTDELEQSAAASEPSVIDKGEDLKNCVEVAVQVHDDSASDYNQLLQQFTTITDKLAASKKEQQHLQSSLEQWQRMGRARDQHMLKFKNENEVLQSKLVNLEASRQQLQAVLKEEIKLQAELVRKVHMSRPEDSLISQKSVSTVDTSVQANYLAVAPDFLRGVEVYGETVLEVVGDKPQKLQWPGYGFYLEVPDGALAPGVTASVGVKMILSGQFKLPENSQLISAIYWISSSEMFLKEVAVNIQHCAVISTEEQCSKFRFIVAKCSQKVLPYTFKEKRGSFNVRTQYAAIKVKQFSMFAETAPEDTELCYTGLVFYKPIPDTLRVDIRFVIVCNLESHLKTIIQDYAAYEEDKLRQLIRFEEDAVEMDLPATVGHWKILPLTYPKIDKADILQFQPGRILTACNIEIEWTGEGQQQAFSHRVMMKGVRKPNNFFQMRYYPKNIYKPAVISNQKAITSSSHTASTQVSAQQEPQLELLNRPPEYLDLLNKVATRVRHKWEEIGLQLQIDRSYLISTWRIKQDVCYFADIFDVWKRSGSPPYTWATIFNVLRAPIVGEVQLAHELEEWVIHSTIQ